MNVNVEKTEKIIEYDFKNKDLILRALTHSSYANEKAGDAAKSNERLEFLGDSILDAVISDTLFHRLPGKAEGELSKIRAAIVCEKSLGELALKTGLNECLLLGRGEAAGGGHKRMSIIADMVESIIAAVYLDGGFLAASEVIHRILKDTIEACISGHSNVKDSKTELQEYFQQRGDASISYEIIAESGPDHAKVFTAAVVIDGKTEGVGEGSSKKHAEFAAAAIALAKFKKD